MQPNERRDSGQNDLFKAGRLHQIVDMGHPLARLAATINGRFLEGRFGAVCSDKPGQPPLSTRLMTGLSLLKPTHELSDEEFCGRWVENPYSQLFCGEEFCVYKPPFDRPSLTRGRQRTGQEKLGALIQESLSAATRVGAAKPPDFSKVIVDTAMQPKAVAFPTDAKLMHRERELLARLAKKHSVTLRQTYARVGKRALMAYQRHAHAKQFRRANRGAAQRAHPSRTGLPRHHAQNPERHEPAPHLRRAAVARLPGAPSASQPARPEGLLAARPRGRMHRQGQGPPPLRVRRQGLARHNASIARKAASSSPT